MLIAKLKSVIIIAAITWIALNKSLKLTPVNRVKYLDSEDSYHVL